MSSVTDLLKQKGLDENLFDKIDINFKDDIGQHTKWLYKHIYSKPYVGMDGKRDQHAIRHVGRAASYVRPLTNFYKQYKDVEALSLTQEDIKLIEIAALFHDAGREGDGDDFWDADSGLLLYYYLKALGVEEKKATLLAEAVANKDRNEKSSHYLELVGENGKKHWVESKAKTKNIYQTLIHDADCLDIIRARLQFKAKYLDIWMRLLGSYDERKNAPKLVETVRRIIHDVRKLVHSHGDSMNNTNAITQLEYECEEVYQKILTDIKFKCPTLYKLSINEKLSFSQDVFFDKKKGITEENLNLALQEQKVFTRGIAAPSTLQKNNDKTEENYASIEINNTKNTNVNRSISLIGDGGDAFSGAGFLILDPELETIHEISKKDIDSGMGKKESYVKKNLTKEDKELALETLKLKLKMGGVTSIGETYTEIIIDISKFDAIYYKQGAYRLGHPKAPLLEAIFIQNEYKKVHGITLPIVEYSRYNNTLTIEKEYSDKEILLLWDEVTSVYIKNSIEHPRPPSDIFDIEDILKQKGLSIFEESAEAIKVSCLYLNPINVTALDSNYEEKLRTAITQQIEECKKKWADEHENKMLNFLKFNETSSIFELKTYLQVVNNNRLKIPVENRIKKELDACLSSEVFHINILILCYKSLFEKLDEKTIDSIQKKVLDYILNQISEADGVSFTFEYCIPYINTFKLQEKNELMKQLISFISKFLSTDGKLFSLLLKHKKNLGKIFEFSDFKEACKQLLTNSRLSLKEKINDKEPDEFLNNYFKVAEYHDLSNKEKIEDVKQFLSKNRLQLFRFPVEHQYSTLEEKIKGLDAFGNIEFFELIIKNLYKETSSEFEFRKYVNSIDHLLSALGNNKFTEEQEKIVKNDMLSILKKEKSIEIYLKYITCSTECRELFTQVIQEDLSSKKNQSVERVDMSSKHLFFQPGPTEDDSLSVKNLVHEVTDKSPLLEQSNVDSHSL